MQEAYNCRENRYYQYVFKYLWIIKSHGQDLGSIVWISKLMHTTAKKKINNKKKVETS